MKSTYILSWDMDQWVPMDIKCSWKCNMFSEEQLYLSNLISLRTNQTKTNYKWVFLILTRLVLANHHLTTLLFLSNFLETLVSIRCTAEWLLTHESKRAATASAWTESNDCPAATHIVRTWVFQVHNFIFPPYSGGEIVINSWEDHTFLPRKKCNQMRAVKYSHLKDSRENLV